MATSTQVSLTGLSYIDSILMGSKWDASTLVYSFPTSASQYILDQNGNYSTDNEVAHWDGALSTAEQQAVRNILASISQFTNLTFVEATNPSQADLKFGRVNDPTALDGAWAHYPGNLEVSGDVWINSAVYSSWNAADLKPGGDNYQTLMHEIGHALGLKHPFQAYGSFPIASNDERYLSHTVMDYYGYGYIPGNSSASNVAPFGYQRNDIAALQSLYGVNETVRGGIMTSYTVGPAGNMFYFETYEDWSHSLETLKPASEPVFYMTLWDGGGMDGLSLNQLSQDQWIDLRPGKGSVFLHDQQLKLNNTQWAANLYNPYGTQSVIEGVNLGSGHNIVVGSAMNDTINGGSGTDIFVVDSLFSENASWVNPNHITVNIASTTGPAVQFSLTSSGFTYFDMSGGLYGFTVDIYGPQGLDGTGGVEEIWFRDKKVVFDLTANYLSATVVDAALSEKFDSEWWSYFAPGSTTDDVLGWLVS
ncbi:MAG: M10 family metallopeptidase [Pseudomonadales bacterium]|nr:M10 family metallopeptidase [Pseudomonadales bacterium]